LVAIALADIKWPPSFPKETVLGLASLGKAGRPPKAPQGNI
jgi:hypothetical protein